MVDDENVWYMPCLDYNYHLQCFGQDMHLFLTVPLFLHICGKLCVNYMKSWLHTHLCTHVHKCVHVSSITHASHTECGNILLLCCLCCFIMHNRIVRASRGRKEHLHWNIWPTAHCHRSSCSSTGCGPIIQHNRRYALWSCNLWSPILSCQAKSTTTFVVLKLIIRVFFQVLQFPHLLHLVSANTIKLK